MTDDHGGTYRTTKTSVKAVPKSIFMCCKLRYGPFKTSNVDEDRKMDEIPSAEAWQTCVAIVRFPFFISANFSGRVHY